MLKCVMFDLDGTLANTLPLCFEAFRRAVEDLSGRRLTDEQINATFGPSEEGSINVLLPGQYGEGTARYWKYYEELHPQLCPTLFPGIAGLLASLRGQGLKLALITGKGPTSLAISLRALGLEGRFDWMESGNPKGNYKAACITRALNGLGLQPEEALYVGDTVSDIEEAGKAGLPTIAAAWAATADRAALKAAGPEALCTTVEELRVRLQTELAG